MSNTRYYKKIEVILPDGYHYTKQQVKADIASAYDVNSENINVNHAFGGATFTYPRVILTRSDGNIRRYNADTTLGIK